MTDTGKLRRVYKVQFDTTNYERSHGHSPRGTGWWIFEIKVSKRQFTFVGSFTEAKKQAREFFNSDDWVIVEVCS